jgi:hypothetical protein
MEQQLYGVKVRRILRQVPEACTNSLDQLLRDALLPSFIVATLPIVAVLVLLGVFRRPAWQASLAGLIVG